MYVEDSRVTTPENPETPIWRYIDFAKFVDMLERSVLHFAQIDALGDPFEGIPSDATLDQIREMGEQLHQLLIARGVRDTNDEWPREPPGRMYRPHRLSIYVNCWHLNEYESMAMWRLYCRDEIAIRSSFSRLIESVRDVPQQITAGKVVYRDRRDRSQPEFPGDIIEAAFRKGMSYEHEREIRAMILVDARPPGQTAFSYEESDLIQRKGYNFGPVNLDVLIDTVYVAPGRPSWFKELVERVMRTYGLDKPPVSSDLDERPDLT
jgi:hypothetical protein